LEAVLADLQSILEALLADLQSGGVLNYHFPSSVVDSNVPLIFSTNRGSSFCISIIWTAVLALMYFIHVVLECNELFWLLYDESHYTLLLNLPNSD